MSFGYFSHSSVSSPFTIFSGYFSYSIVLMTWPHCYLSLIFIFRKHALLAKASQATFYTRVTSNFSYINE